MGTHEVSCLVGDEAIAPRKLELGVHLGQVRNPAQESVVEVLSGQAALEGEMYTHRHFTGSVDGVVG